MDLEAETLSESRFVNAAHAHIGFGICFFYYEVFGPGCVEFSQHVLAKVGLRSATLAANKAW